MGSQVKERGAEREACSVTLNMKFTYLLGIQCFAPVEWKDLVQGKVEPVKVVKVDHMTPRDATDIPYDVICAKVDAALHAIQEDVDSFILNQPKEVTLVIGGNAPAPVWFHIGRKLQTTFRQRWNVEFAQTTHINSSVRGQVPTVQLFPLFTNKAVYDPPQMFKTTEFNCNSCATLFVLAHGTAERSLMSQTLIANAAECASPMNPDPNIGSFEIQPANSKPFTPEDALFVETSVHQVIARFPPVTSIVIAVAMPSFVSVIMGACLNLNNYRKGGVMLLDFRQGRYVSAMVY